MHQYQLLATEDVVKRTLLGIILVQGPYEDQQSAVPTEPKAPRITVGSGKKIVCAEMDAAHALDSPYSDYPPRLEVYDCELGT